MRGKPIGSTRIDQYGYLRLKVSNEKGVWPVRWPLAHRWAMEQKLGRSLRPEEAVHHLCRNKQCYNPEHLELLSWEEHQKIHHAGRKHSPEEIEKRRSGQIACWDKPGYRKFRTLLMLKHWTNSEYRAKQSASRKAAWVNRKAAPGWQHNAVGHKDSPGVIAQRSQALSAYWTANRKRASALAKARWKDPAYREKMEAANEKNSERRSEKYKELWQDPTFRAKQMANRR